MSLVSHLVRVVFARAAISGVMRLVNSWRLRRDLVSRLKRRIHLALRTIRKGRVNRLARIRDQNGSLADAQEAVLWG